MTIPHTTPVAWSDLHPRPESLAAAIQTQSAEGCRIALLGLPDDTGIGLSSSRTGARRGPAAFRRVLARYAQAYDALSGRDLSAIGIFDAGDVSPAGDEIHITHDRVTEAIRVILEQGMIPVCIGGGQDLTCAALRAVWRSVERLGGVKVDAHLDAAPRVCSQMLLRRVIEHSDDKVAPRSLHVVGLEPFSNTKSDIEWARAQGVNLVFYDHDERDLIESFRGIISGLQSEPATFATFDLDVMEGAFAPGVAGLNPTGFTPAVGAAICREIGRLRNLRYFDLMELSPPHDVEDRTAMLTAHLFMSFLAGFAEAHL